MGQAARQVAAHPGTKRGPDHAPAGPITSPLEPAGANEARDSLAKALYARCFDWLVERINASMVQHAAACNASRTATPVAPGACAAIAAAPAPAQRTAMVVAVPSTPPALPRLVGAAVGVQDACCTHLPIR